MNAEDARRALAELSDRFSSLNDTAEISFVAGEVLGHAMHVSRAGYGTIDPVAESISVERDWNAPGVKTIAGTLLFRDHGTYIDDLKRGETVVCSDAFEDPRTAETAHVLQAIDARSFINMPVTEEGGFVALLYVNQATARHWTEAELDFLREVAARTRTVIERRRAEHALRDLNASLERLVAERTRERDRIWEMSRDLLVVIAGDGRAKRINPAWIAKFGIVPGPDGEITLLDLVHPEDRSRLLVIYNGMLAGAPTPDFEIRMKGATEEPYRTISWAVVAAEEDYYASGRDVTEQRKAEEALRQSQKMEAVGQLTGGIAHDFNNLLTGITGSLQLLEARIAEGRLEAIPRYIDGAQSSAKRAAALTQRLLAFSRRQTLDPKPVRTNRLVSDMEELIRRTIGPTIEMEVVGAIGLWPTLVDPNQLENALLNLCINARDAMPDGGRITIETANKWLDDRAARQRDLPPGQYVSLCVTDTGIGMTPEVIERAFDPFFTTKPLGEGTGLGLSMIYGFVRQSGGQVRVYSEVGQGTTMCLYLPRYQGDDDDTAEFDASMSRAEQFGQGETVLVIDDEPVVRMLITDVLDDCGYNFIEADDGPTGMKILQSDVRIDLLITDVGLPGGMHGRQVADAARSLRPGLKVLFVTGYAENAVVGNGHLERGMEVITKPFAVAALGAKVNAMIESAR